MTPAKEESYRCQFCEREAPVSEWGDGGYTCPHCGRHYDAMLAQDSEE